MLLKKLFEHESLNIIVLLMLLKKLFEHESLQKLINHIFIFYS
jgi:hypothetical protein